MLVNIISIPAQNMVRRKPQPIVNIDPVRSLPGIAHIYRIFQPFPAFFVIYNIRSSCFCRGDGMMYHIKTKPHSVFGVGIKSEILLQVQVLDVRIEIDLAAVTLEIDIEVIIAVNERSIGKQPAVQYTV